MISAAIWRRAVPLPTTELLSVFDELAIPVRRRVPIPMTLEVIHF